MKILMLGNSFTFYNDMPKMVASLTGAEVREHTRGGARLAEQLNPNTRMGTMTLSALKDEKWDYVVLQEMSNGAIVSREKFLRSVSALCALIRKNGATPVIFSTWAYAPNSGKLRDMEMTYEEMTLKISDACHAASARGNALVADVGHAFLNEERKAELYSRDGMHPSKLGSELAARTIANVIANDDRHFIYFTRHGETVWNVENKICGATDIELTELGRKQAHCLGRRIIDEGIKIDAILTSPLIRAHETAQIVSNITGIPFKVEPRLKEQCFGIFEATPRDSEEFKKAKENFVYSFEGGESMLRLCARIYSLLDELKEQRNKTCLLVAHNGISRAFESYFRDIDNEEFAAFGIENCGLLKERFQTARV